MTKLIAKNLAIFLLPFVLLAPLAFSADTVFKDIELVVIKENGDKSLKSADLLVGDEFLSVTRKGSADIRADYKTITKIVYEKSAHPRWKTAIFVSPWFLLSKGKKHWLTVNWKEATGTGNGYFVIKMEKGNFRDILAMVESKANQAIERIQEN